jgi:hypothetical protein
MIIAIDTIHPQKIVDAFGPYQIGIAESLKGEGHPNDGRFQDIVTDWTPDPAEIIKTIYLRRLVRLAKSQRSNFIEFWGWPEIRYRDDVNAGMVFSRVRFLHVIAVPNGRPN